MSHNKYIYIYIYREREIHIYIYMYITVLTILVTTPRCLPVRCGAQYPVMGCGLLLCSNSNSHSTSNRNSNSKSKSNANSNGNRMCSMTAVLDRGARSPRIARVGANPVDDSQTSA